MKIGSKGKSYQLAKMWVMTKERKRLDKLRIRNVIKGCRMTMILIMREMKRDYEG